MLILGTTIRLHDSGKATHRLEDDLVMIGLTAQLREELGTSWYACVTYANGKQVMRGLTDTTPGPSWPVRDVMLKTSIKLNRDLHHNGCWIVAYHSERLVFMWRDWDGDLGFMMQVDEPWTRIKGWAVEEYCERVETAFDEFRNMLRKVELKPEHTILKAKGQKPALH